MGFTSPTYADPVYTCTGPNEAYLFGSALNSSYSGNLVYATDSTGSTNYHQWYVGGFTQAKSAWKMQLTGSTLQLGSSVGINMSGQLTSTATTGTAPFVVASTTQVANLNVAQAGKVTNALTAGTNITFSSGTTFDGSAAITINASGGGTSAPALNVTLQQNFGGFL